MKTLDNPTGVSTPHSSSMFGNWYRTDAGTSTLDRPVLGSKLLSSSTVIVARIDDPTPPVVGGNDPDKFSRLKARS